MPTNLVNNGSTPFFTAIETVQKHWGWFLGLGILLILLGILSISYSVYVTASGVARVFLPIYPEDLNSKISYANRVINEFDVLTKDLFSETTSAEIFLETSQESTQSTLVAAFVIETEAKPCFTKTKSIGFEIFSTSKEDRLVEGRGKFLLDTIIKTAKHRGAKAVHTSCATENFVFQDFLTKNEFVQLPTENITPDTNCFYFMKKLQEEPLEVLLDESSESPKKRKAEKEADNSQTKKNRGHCGNQVSLR